jgi:hypothetical protein
VIPADYRELRERIADGITLRQSTDFYCAKVPKHDAFNRSFNRLTPATLMAGAAIDNSAHIRPKNTVYAACIWIWRDRTSFMSPGFLETSQHHEPNPA